MCKYINYWISSCGNLKVDKFHVSNLDITHTPQFVYCRCLCQTLGSSMKKNNSCNEKHFKIILTMSQKTDLEVNPDPHPILRYRPRPIPPSSLKFQWNIWIFLPLTVDSWQLQLAWKFMFSTPLNKGKLWVVKSQLQQQKCFPILTSGVFFALNVQGNEVWMFQWLRVHRGCSSTSATARRTRSSWPGDGWRSKMRKTSQGDNQIK